MRPYARYVAVASLAVLGACGADRATAPNAAPSPAADQIGAANMNAAGTMLAFAPEAHPFGRNMIQWSEDWWKFILSIPASKNPELDMTGADCNVSQHGNVWYIATVAGSTVTRTCTIPREKSLMINLSGVLNDYPCPDTSFHPAPGQSLQDFLTQGAMQVVNMVNSLTLTVDGKSVPNLFSYRYTSPLFYYTGNTTLQTQLDGCITGHSQPAVSDGYYIMLHPLSPGQHVLVFTASDTQGNNASITYNLTVKSGDGD